MISIGEFHRIQSGNFLIYILLSREKYITEGL